MTRSSARSQTRFLLILDDPTMPEAENWPEDQKIEWLRRTTDADPSIVRFAVINSDLVHEPQQKFLLWLMRKITADYHKGDEDED